MAEASMSSRPVGLLLPETDPEVGRCARSSFRQETRFSGIGSGGVSGAAPTTADPIGRRIIAMWGRFLGRSLTAVDLR
jgi:hypothetical protein